MKKHLPISLLILLVVSAILYLIPNFSITNNGQRYTFINFPSAFDKAYPDLALNFPGQTSNYKISIESKDKIDSPDEWSRSASRDQKTLEQRLESIVGNDYELRLNNDSGKIQFGVTTSDRIYNPTAVTSQNSIFQVYSNTTPSVSTTTGDTTGSEKKLLDFKREDFGFAEVVSAPTQDQSTGQPQYTVRMPLGLFLGPDKIQLINDNLFSQLSLTTSEAEYNASFDYNQAGVPTHLLVTKITSKTEAEYLRAFLNTPPYKVEYQKISENFYVNNTKQVAILMAIFVLILSGAIILNRYTIKNLNLNKLLLIIGLLIIYIASLKLFAIPLTITNLLLMSVIVLFTLFNSRVEYYLTLIGILLLTKLLGFLPGFDISTGNLILIAIFTFLIWLTNYVQKSDKKYI